MIRRRAGVVRNRPQRIRHGCSIGPSLVARAVRPAFARSHVYMCAQRRVGSAANRVRRERRSGRCEFRGCVHSIMTAPAPPLPSPPPQTERVSLRYHDNVLSKGVEHAQGDAHLHYMAITINRLPDGTAESSSGFP